MKKTHDILSKVFILIFLALAVAIGLSWYFSSEKDGVTGPASPPNLLPHTPPNASNATEEPTLENMTKRKAIPTSWIKDKKKIVKNPLVIVCGNSYYECTEHTGNRDDISKEIKEVEELFRHHGRHQIFHLGKEKEGIPYHFRISSAKELKKALKNKVVPYLETTEGRLHDGIIVYVTGFADDTTFLTSKGSKLTFKSIEDLIRESIKGVEDLPFIYMVNTLPFEEEDHIEEGGFHPHQRYIHIWAGQDQHQVKDYLADGMASPFAEVLKACIEKYGEEASLQELCQLTNKNLISTTQGVECSNIEDHLPCKVYLKQKGVPAPQSKEGEPPIQVLQNPCIAIIGTSYYAAQDVHHLPGTTQDIDLLKELFESKEHRYGYQVFFEGKEVTENGKKFYKQDKKTLFENLEKLKEYLVSAEGKKHDGLILFFCGHGNLGGFLVSDTKTPITYQKALSPFNTHNLPSWKDKPIISCCITCRGEQKAAGIYVPAANHFVHREEVVEMIQVHQCDKNTSIFPLAASLLEKQQDNKEENGIPSFDFYYLAMQLQAEQADSTTCFCRNSNVPIPIHFQGVGGEA